MYIKSVYFKSFGAFHDKTVEFEKGLNIIRGDNEAGKSTTADLIKFVFYGATPNEKKLLAPFGETLISGSVKVDLDGEEYVAVRTVDKKTETKIFHDGEEVNTDLCPGEYFTGITTADVFSSTVFSGSRQGGSYSSETYSAIQNMVAGGDERFSAKGAIADLNKTRKEYILDKGNGGKIYELGKEITELNLQRNDYAESFARLDGINEELSSLEVKKKELEAEKSALDTSEDDFKLLQRRKDAIILSTEKDEMDTVQKERDEFFETHQHGDKMPDPGDQRVLGEKQNERNLLNNRVEILKKSIEESTRILEECKEEFEKKKAENTPKAQKKEKTANLLSRLLFFPVTFFAVAVIASVVILLLELNKKIVLTVCAPVAFISLFAFIVMLILKYLNKNKSVDLEEPPELVEKRRFYEKKQAEDNENLKSEGKRLEEVQKRFDELCAAWKVSNENCVAELGNVINHYENLNKSSEEKSEKYISHKTLFDISEDEFPVDDGREIILPEGYNAASYVTESNRIANGLASIESRMKELCTERGKIEALGGPTEIDEKLHEKEELKKKYENEVAAIRLAVEALATAQDEAKKSLTPLITEGANGRLKAITGGKYDKIHLFSDLSFSFEPDGSGEPRDKDYMSTGTLESAYLALRLSLASVMSKTPLPFILDETLNHFDDSRLKNALEILSGGEQVILFTVSNREKDLCEKEKIKATATEF